MGRLVSCSLQSSFEEASEKKIKKKIFCLSARYPQFDDPLQSSAFVTAVLCVQSLKSWGRWNKEKEF